MKYLQYYIILCIILLPLLSVGQKTAPARLPKFDSRKLHFGFILGYNSAGFLMDLKKDSTFSDSLLSLTDENVPGFNLQIVSSYALRKGLRIRFLPGLSFQDRLLNYDFLEKDSSITHTQKRIQSTFLDFPLDLKMRTLRMNNFAAYIIAGGKYSIDMASQKDVKNSGSDIIVKINKSDWSYEVGGGTDFFFEYFKFGVELKLAVGIKNILIQDNTRYSSPIDKLRTKLWTLSFTFEG